MNRPEPRSFAVTRREVLRTGTAVAAAAVGGRLFAAEPAAPAAEVGPIEVVSKQPAYYHGWPTLARRAGGELLLVCSGGREAHVCPFGRVELMTSRDGGRTWTWPRVLLDSATDDRDAGAVEASDGSLVVTTFTSLAYEPVLKKLRDAGGDPARLARWAAADARLSPEDRKADVGTWAIRSTDGGRTWSPRTAVPLNSPHGPVLLADGRLLYAGVELWTPARRVGVAESTDHGATWRWLADLPTRPGDDSREYHELHAVEAASGRLVVHVRNHNKANAGETLQSESDDGGKTWTAPHPIGVWGLPSHLLRLADGRLLTTYGHRRPPFGNQARVSGDDGRTWSAPIPLSTDGAGGDLGYPSTVQLDDGGLLTAWYESLAGNPRAVLRQVRWRLTG